MKNLVILILLFALGAFFFGGYKEVFVKALSYSPCERPISYRIDQVDPQFRLSKEEFTKASEKAAKIWSVAYGKTLFVSDPQGDQPLSVNLVFDDRQSLMNKVNLQQTKLEQEKKSIDPQVADYEKKVHDFELRLNDFNRTVADWNQKGGAPPEEYEKLKKEERNLKAEADRLNALAQKLNQETNSYNFGVNNLNSTIDTFNTNLQYKPEEGLFEGKDNKITIFFDVNESELLHTLAHEFGHARGLDHIDNPKAIMFPKTTQVIEPSDEDLSQLREICRTRSYLELLRERLRNRGIII